jgi:hypothetical protein
VQCIAGFRDKLLSRSLHQDQFFTFPGPARLLFAMQNTSALTPFRYVYACGMCVYVHVKIQKHVTVGSHDTFFTMAFTTVQLCWISPHPHNKVHTRRVALHQSG